MNFTKQNSVIKKPLSNILLLTILLVLYSIFAYIYRERLFQKFESRTVSDYLRSQDVFDPEEKIKDRIFVSDEVVYIATGYLYANGTDPTVYNGPHTPLIKYLFGFSSRFFNMPLLPNVVFGAVLLFEVFLLGLKAFKSNLVGFLASLLLLVDPVFKEVTTYVLLDLGQMVFILAFVITALFYEKRSVLQGVFLGLAAASKFYSPVVIFLGLIYLYKLVNKKLNIKKETLMLLVAAIVFSLVYTKSFLNGFNIFIFQAKIVKYMLDHNTSPEWGRVLPMFFGGWFLWPLSLIASIYVLFKEKFMNTKFLIALIPIVYFSIMTFQLPFTRYFILLLPFLYISLSALVFRKMS